MKARFRRCRRRGPSWAAASRARQAGGADRDDAATARVAAISATVSAGIKRLAVHAVFGKVVDADRLEGSCTDMQR